MKIIQVTRALMMDGDYITFPPNEGWVVKVKGVGECALVRWAADQPFTFYPLDSFQNFSGTYMETRND